MKLMMMSVPRHVVIVSGPPASGKTTLAKRLAADFSLPLIAKDGIKEALFETLGTGDREWSQRLGRGSFALIWHFLEVELAVGRSALVEGNFDADHGAAELTRLRRRFGFKALQLHCRAPAEVLYQRYERRITDRHPGHVDKQRLADIREHLDPDRYLLPLPDDLLIVDTTSFDSLDYSPIHEALRHHLDS